MKQMKKTKKRRKDDLTIICIHCRKKIMKVNLRGLSLICPLCHRPGNAIIRKNKIIIK